MPSATQKGNHYEGEARSILELNGWKPEGQHRKVGWIPDRGKPFVNGRPPLKMIMMGRDLFGCDIIAKKAREKNLFIQVSTPTNKSAKIKQIMGEPWNYDHDTVQIWLRKEGVREFDVYEAPTFEFIGTWNVAGLFRPNPSRANLPAIV